jgi:hydroxymethylpyrimidine pyrophosphatase-like HAD family hydrolase/fructoselysine-6-P-deglycase FrlB-like protein
MGRSYAVELEELLRTYSWALDTCAESLADTIASSAQSPLLAVASGGSLTAAHFACLLHTQFTGRFAQVCTPYELIGSPLSLEDVAVLILSAGGSNPDVLACAEHVASRIPRYLTAVTTRPDSPLGERLQRLSWPTVHAFDTPTRKDGFLATNSLLATLVLLARAYATAFDIPVSLPPTLDLLVHPGQTWQEYVKSWAPQVLPLLKRQTLVVLHGGVTKTAAADIESRFTEAALGNVQVADFRNFAHGRHHWLAVNADDSAVLSLSSPQDHQIANRTLSLIPKEIPRLRIDVDGTIAGVISCVCQSVYLAYVAGMQKGIDPGRPHVPLFGRKLYHLNAKPRSGPGLAMSERMEVAIQRKSGFSCRTLAARCELEAWIQYYRDFVDKLGRSEIDAVIFDYDGTLCGPRRRCDGPSDAITKKLTALLKAGVVVGIATGRGKSVRHDLRNRIRTSALRRRVILAYHNGAEIGSLDDVTTPPETSPLSNNLEGLTEQLLAIPQVAKHAEITAKGSQITIQLSKRADVSAVFEAVSRVIRDVAPPGVAVVSSTHSIDVLAPGISKLLLLTHLQQHCGRGANDSRVICIGDRGRWPGNDTDLLNHTLSLSVDEVSRDPGTCWNLSAPGHRYDLSCLEYLEMLMPTGFGARFNVEGL